MDFTQERSNYHWSRRPKSRARLSFTLGPRRPRMTKIEEFFARYEEGANSFGANSFDPDLVCSQYTTEFMAGGPDGVACGRNDQALREAFIQRHTLFQQIGFKRA